MQRLLIGLGVALLLAGLLYIVIAAVLSLLTRYGEARLNRHQPR